MLKNKKLDYYLLLAIFFIVEKFSIFKLKMSEIKYLISDIRKHYRVEN